MGFGGRSFWAPVLPTTRAYCVALSSGWRLKPPFYFHTLCLVFFNSASVGGEGQDVGQQHSVCFWCISCRHWLYFSGGAGVFWLQVGALALGLCLLHLFPLSLHPTAARGKLLALGLCHSTLFVLAAFPLSLSLAPYSKSPLLNSLLWLCVFHIFPLQGTLNGYTPGWQKWEVATFLSWWWEWKLLQNLFLAGSLVILPRSFKNETALASCFGDTCWNIYEWNDVCLGFASKHAKGEDKRRLALSWQLFNLGEGCLHVRDTPCLTYECLRISIRKGLSKAKSWTLQSTF